MSTVPLTQRFEDSGRFNWLWPVLVAAATVLTLMAFPGGAQAAGAYLIDASTISAGGEHTCAIRKSNPTDAAGQAVCWGDNFYGQLGDGTITDRSMPVVVKGVGGTGELTGVTAISAGYLHTCALRTDGKILCWGRNANGQLGDGTINNGRSTPVMVKGVGGTGELTGVTTISAGAFYTCAIGTGGRLSDYLCAGWAWS